MTHHISMAGSEAGSLPKEKQISLLHQGRNHTSLPDIHYTIIKKCQPFQIGLGGGGWLEATHLGQEREAIQAPVGNPHSMDPLMETVF